jgi:HEPN domain-containing protein
MEWIQTAKDDIEVSIRSYDSSNFNNAVYQLQQTLEKLAKSYALYLGLFKENDLRSEIGHLPNKIYIKLLEMRNIDKIVNFFGVQSNINVYSERLKCLDKKEILKMDNDIPEFLKIHKKIMKKIAKSLSEEETKKIVRELKSYRDIENFLKVSFDFGYLIMPLSVITCVHESPSRYPDELRNLDIDYRKTKLIENYQKIVINIKQIIKRFTNLIDDERRKGIDWEKFNLDEFKRQFEVSI